MKISLVFLGLIVPLTAGFLAPSSLSTSQKQIHNVKNNPPATTALNIAAPEALQGAWTAYSDALEANPLVVKSVTAGVILGAADLAGQAVEDVKSGRSVGDDVDLARTVRFAIFGLVLQAPWNHFYYQFLDGAIPPTEEPWTSTTAIKTFIDQFLQAPVFTVLIFAFLGFLEGKNFKDIQKQLEDDYKDTMIANWGLWVPASFINLAFVPPIFRVLYLNVVFFFWSIFLSLKLNKEEA
jgi:peroxisomal membrane protein 2